ncbi:MAG: sensor histidine kinase [Ferruginibacter sp.]
MRLFFLCCLTGFITAPAHGQLLSDSTYAQIRAAKDYPTKIKGYLTYGEKTGSRDFEDVIRVKLEGIQLAGKNGDALSAGLLKRQTGEAFYFKGNYDAAAAYLYESVALLEKVPDKTKLATSYNALAKLYRKTRDLKRSMENYDRAMAIFRSVNDSAGVAMIYNESGVVFEYSGEYDKAAARYTASLNIDKRLNDIGGICYALSNLAGLYTLQKKFPEAENYLLQALAFRKALKDSFALALNYSDLGNTYFSAGSHEKAKAYIDTSIRISSKMGYPELTGSNYDMLGKIAEQQGNYQTALAFYKKKSVIGDSIFSLEKAKQIEELNTRYETVKKERTIQDQENKITLQNIFIAAAIGLVLLGSLLAYTQYRKYQWRQEAKNRAEILKQQELAAVAVIEAEEAERHRIATDLHDGVGQIMSAAKMNLSAFEHRAEFKTADEKLSFEKIISLVDAGCKEVRTVSHNMMPNAMMKNNLAAAIREFLDKLDDRALKVHFYSEGFEEGSNSNAETILYRVIQECVNNVIKHSRADTVDISLIKDENEISATIEDNGIGFDVHDRRKQEGIGLKNIRTRVEFLKGTVEITASPGEGTLVALHIPL